MKDNSFSPNFSLNFKGNLRVYKQPIVMGILNVTPDSFYKESRSNGLAQVMPSVTKMIDQGVDIIDIGGYSSRPGATHISVEEELTRIIEPIKKIKQTYPTSIISIDTFRSEVAEKAIQAGADMINDISGGKADQNIFNIASKYNTPICLMHMKGTPQNMQSNTDYNSLISELIQFFSSQISLAKKHNVKDVIIDPGLGFSKTLSQNYQLIQKLPQLNILDCPILVGASRKSMLYNLLKITPAEALNATTTINTIALMNQAKLLRVHDVKEAKEAIRIYTKTFHSEQI